MMPDDTETVRLTAELRAQIGECRWTVSVRNEAGEQIAWWRADTLPDVQAVKACFSDPTHVVQYRFLH